MILYLPEMFTFWQKTIMVVFGQLMFHMIWQKANLFLTILRQKYSSSCSWELVLNPKGGNAYGCIASGTITSI